ncbi:MAG TPA: hypothetical protein VJ844_02565 [Mucilaginibacter sp.]|nr:hypothetical protein [Mucilaginibacter sp.]
MNIYQTLSLVIPILSVIIVGVITYYFAIKSKKFELLYESKIPAFKEISAKLTEYKTFCWGRVAYYQGNAFSPYYSDQLKALHHRTEIAKSYESNSIFLSKRNRNAIIELLNAMSILCNIELQIASYPNNTNDYSDAYELAAKKVDSLIEMLYDDLNLK